MSCFQNRVAGLQPTEWAFRIFESLVIPLISKDEIRNRRMGAEELWDEQMFEFGASHKAARRSGVTINIRVFQQSWNYSIHGYKGISGY